MPENTIETTKEETREEGLARFKAIRLRMHEAAHNPATTVEEMDALTRDAIACHRKHGISWGEGSP